MYFVVEYQGQRKTVKAKSTATLTEVNHLAFGLDELGDIRAKDVLVIGSTRRADVVAGMMCQVWPAHKTTKCVQCKTSDARWDSIYCSEACKRAFLSFSKESR
jgi:hypothetical protein